MAPPQETTVCFDLPAARFASIVAHIEPFALFLFALALLINAGTPGTSITALVSRVISSGWRGITPFVAAIWIGEVIWLTVAMAGLSALAETFPCRLYDSEILGGGLLRIPAWKMWHEDRPLLTTKPYQKGTLVGP